MDKPANRRQFLQASAVASAAILTASKTILASVPDEEAPIFKISLAQWSLHKALHAKEMTNLDFPSVTKEKFGIEAVEYVNQFFKDKAEDEAYLGQLQQRCEDSGVKSLLIMVDGEGAIGDASAEARKKAVENHFRWVTAAKTLGCHSIRVNASSSGEYQEQAKLASDGLRQLCEFAQPLGINVIVENHGGLSSNGQWLTQVIRNVNLDNCGTLPDFGNFHIQREEPEIVYDRYLGVAAMLPFAKAVSAKSYDFDDAGNETLIDYAKMLTMVKDSGYRGYVGVEYEGERLSESDGILATRDLLIQCREQLAS